MGVQDIIVTLKVWTPYLGQGFLLNLVIAVVAMILGTAIGWGLGGLRAVRARTARAGATAMTVAFRNIPSFVFMYYIAFMTPVEFLWDGELVRFPAWAKASIALTIPVVGFVSDQMLRLIEDRRGDVPNAFGSFAVAWIQYLLIILMASSTASVIGVDEVVGRANTVIAAVRDPALIVWIYAYIGLWFLFSGFAVSKTLKWLRVRFHNPAKHLRLEE